MLSGRHPLALKGGSAIRLAAGLNILCLMSVSALLADAIVSQSEALSKEREARAMGLELELKTDKQTYNLGEPILITATLRNTGHETLYLSPELTTRLADPVSIGTVYLAVLTSGEEPLRRRLAHSYITRRKDTRLYEFILGTRRAFRPGNSRSITRRLEEFGFKIDDSGRYQLRAKYNEQSFRDYVTNEEFEEAEKKVGHPWWAEVESEWVWIEILPR